MPSRGGEGRVEILVLPSNTDLTICTEKNFNDENMLSKIISHKTLPFGDLDFVIIYRTSMIFL